VKPQILRKKNKRQEVRNGENDKVRKNADVFCVLKKIQSETKDRL
jgi:hypothetical protein